MTNITRNVLIKVTNPVKKSKKKAIGLAIAQLWVLFFINISHFDFAPCEGFVYDFEVRWFHGERVEP